MRKISLNSLFIILFLLSLALNIAYLSDQDCSEIKSAKVSSISYEERKNEAELDLKGYLTDELKLNPKDSALVLEIIRQIPLDVEKFVKPRADEFAKKYGNSTSSYIYQAEDYVFLGNTRLTARKKISDLIGPKKWDELSDYIQKYNQKKSSSGAVFLFEI